MSNSNSSGTRGGLGICSLVTIIFIVLKVVGVAPVASWSWVWVFSPLWLGFLIGVAWLVLFFVIAAVAHMVFKR